MDDFDYGVGADKSRYEVYIANANTPVVFSVSNDKTTAISAAKVALTAAGYKKIGACDTVDFGTAAGSKKTNDGDSKKINANFGLLKVTGTNVSKAKALNGKDIDIIFLDVKNGQIQQFTSLEVTTDLTGKLGEYSTLTFKSEEDSFNQNKHKTIDIYSEKSGLITAFADGTVGTVVTSAGHGLSDGDIVYIGGSAHYSGTFEIGAVTSNEFSIIREYAAETVTAETKWFKV